MSGFEVAGIILGAFPLLYETASDIRGVFKDVKSWWRFENEFEDFIAAIEREQIAYSQSIEILLDGLDIPENDSEALQVNPSCTLWHEPRIQTELRRRIQNKHYTWFTRQIGEMNEALGELMGLLPIGKIYHVDSRSLESEIFRLKKSFSHRKDRLLVTVKDKNKAIYEFLDRASHVPSSIPARRKRYQTQAPIGLQEQASILHSRFQSKWHCKCPEGHSCGIAVSGPGKGTGMMALHIKMLFEDSSRRTQVKVVLESDLNAGTIAPGPSASPNSQHPPSSTQEQPKLAEIANLSHQSSVKGRFKKLRENGQKGVFSLAISAIGALGNPSGHGNQKVQWNKPDSKLGERSNPTALSPDLKSRQPVPPLMENADGLNPLESSGLASSRSGAFREQQAKLGRRVQFVDEGYQSAPFSRLPQSKATTIDDLCRALNDLSGEHIGFLDWEPDKRLVLCFDPSDQSLIQNHKAETVESFLQCTRRRDLRLRIGCSLALTVLNLGSPWLPDKWDKTDLVILQGPLLAVPQLYFHHSSLEATLSNLRQSSLSGRTRASLFSLGVLLLELVFGETLEQQPFRSEYLGTTGQPNDMTDWCTAVRWQQRVVEDLGDDLAEAILRCLRCEFEDPNLDSPQFAHSVWQNVVQPVENFLAAWG